MLELARILYSQHCSQRFIESFEEKRVVRRGLPINRYVFDRIEITTENRNCDLINVNEFAELLKDL